MKEYILKDNLHLPSEADLIQTFSEAFSLSRARYQLVECHFTERLLVFVPDSFVDDLSWCLYNINWVCVRTDVESVLTRPEWLWHVHVLGLVHCSLHLHLSHCASA